MYFRKEVRSVTKEATMSFEDCQPLARKAI